MSIALDSTAAARIANGAAGGSYGVAWLVDMEFSTGTIYFTNAPLQVNAAGNSYLALGSFVDVGNLQESADTAADRLSIALSVASSAMLAAAMGDPATYRGRAARLYLQRIEQVTGVPIHMVSTSPDRDHTILLTHPYIA